MRYAPPKILWLLPEVDALYDRVNAAYRAEWDRWSYMRLDDEPARGSPYVLRRNSSPDGNIIADEYIEQITFSKRECKNRDDAEMWLNTYRDRAAIQAALREIVK